MNSEIQNLTIAQNGWYPLVRKIIVITGIFAFILSILMIANYIQTTSIEPLNNQALNQLMLQLQKEPDNQALKEQIRALDLLARKAYFTNQWQIRTGGFLLFAAIIILLLSFKFLNARKTKFPDLETTAVPNMSWEEKILARKSITYTGIGLFVVALLASLLSQSDITADGSETINSASSLTIDQIHQNWNAFRGPNGLGIAYQTDIPTSWDGASGENIIWKKELSKPGYNSPIIWENKIFISAADKNSQEVYCFDTETGNILWKTELNNIPDTPDKKPKVTKDTGYAAPTMTTDGQKVYVIFATGDIAALDLNGQQIWAKNLGVPKNHYGHSSSLILYEQLLLIQYDHNDGQNLIALRSSNGDQVYSTVRSGVQISWASPILIDTGERKEIVLNSSPFVVSYNPLNGQELWRVDCMYGEVGPSLAFSDQTVFAVNDLAILAAIKMTDEPSIVWEYDEDLPEASSPVATPEYLFVATGFGPVSCFDVKSGEQYWMHEFDEGFYSSPIVVDNFVYLIDKKGVTHIFKADKQFELISEPALGEEVVTIPAFMPGRIYVRGSKNLYCIGIKNDG
jgi:outer membrane protein assembly factor BamB